MYSGKRTSQGGSVAIFLIVSVLLAAAVVGGVYFVHQRGNQIHTTQPVAKQPTPAPSSSQQKIGQSDPDAAKKQEEARKQAEATKQAEEAKQKAAEQAAKEQEQQKQQDQQRVAQNNASQSSGVTAPSPSTTSHLPTTGPEDTLAGLVAAGVLIAVVGAYLRSYKHRFGSLLR